MAGHVLGMTETFTGLGKFASTMRAGGKRAGDGPFIDGLTAVQVDATAGLSTGELIDRLEAAGPVAARWRARRRLMRHIPMKEEIDGVKETWQLGYLVDIILTRDTWMHRADIAKATGKPMELTAGARRPHRRRRRRRVGPSPRPAVHPAPHRSGGRHLHPGRRWRGDHDRRGGLLPHPVGPGHRRGPAGPAGSRSERHDAESHRFGGDGLRAAARAARPPGGGARRRAAPRRSRSDLTEDTWIAAPDRTFSLELGKRGWLGMTWPVEAGGGGRSPLERFVVFEALIGEGAPLATSWFADRQMGPTLLQFGTEAQQREHLPAILDGSSAWSIGMSEPDAGSDVASIRTRAVRDGDDFVVNGQKIWNSGAASADFIYLIVRTDPDAPPHAGLSELIVDMRSPGITIQPIKDMTASDHFCEVWFEDVRVPAENLVGELNGSFRQVMRQMEHERGGIDRLLSNRKLYVDVLPARRHHRSAGAPGDRGASRPATGSGG